MALPHPYFKHSNLNKKASDSMTTRSTSDSITPISLTVVAPQSIRKLIEQVDHHSKCLPQTNVLLNTLLMHPATLVEPILKAFRPPQRHFLSRNAEQKCSVPCHSLLAQSLSNQPRGSYPLTISALFPKKASGRPGAPRPGPLIMNWYPCTIKYACGHHEVTECSPTFEVRFHCNFSCRHCWGPQLKHPWGNLC